MRDITPMTAHEPGATQTDRGPAHCRAQTSSTHEMRNFADVLFTKFQSTSTNKQSPRFQLQIPAQRGPPLHHSLPLPKNEPHVLGRVGRWPDGQIFPLPFHFRRNSPSQSPAETGLAKPARAAAVAATRAVVFIVVFRFVLYFIRFSLCGFVFALACGRYDRRSTFQVELVLRPLRSERVKERRPDRSFRIFQICQPPPNTTGLDASRTSVVDNG